MKRCEDEKQKCWLAYVQWNYEIEDGRAHSKRPIHLWNVRMIFDVAHPTHSMIKMFT